MTITFRPTKKVAAFFETIENKNQFLNELFELMADKEIQIVLEQTHNESHVRAAAQTEAEKLEQDKKIAQINYINGRIDQIKEETRYTRIKANIAEEFGGPLPQAATRTLKANLPTSPPAGALTHNGSLYCPGCNESFRYTSQATLQAQKEALLDHYFQSHGPNFPAEAAESLKMLTYQ